MNQVSQYSSFHNFLHHEISGTKKSGILFTFLLVMELFFRSLFLIVNES
jgi:hypothetical protein